jgi:signal transduction histidine kinase
MKSNIATRAIVLASIMWTSVITSIFIWDRHTEQRHVEELAKKEARSNFNKDLAFRMWATGHGGVYVSVNKSTPPNPGLAHIPERDIETPSGKKLTLMNPAYILRQVMDEYSELYGIKGKITSFKLLNPKNAPDEWEAAALRRFEQGEKEVFEFADMNGQPYLRLMKPMIVVEGCLKCHAFQGYKVGDVRGGVGVSIPMQPYLEDLSSSLRPHLVTYSIIWLFGMGLIITLIQQVRSRFDDQARSAADLEQQSLIIARTNADLQRFAEVTAHHLQEPARRISNYTDRLKQQLGDQLIDSEARISLDFIGQEARRQKKLLHDVESYLAADQPRGKIESIDVNRAVADILARMKMRISQIGAEITLGNLPPARIDLPRLNDLFEVILDNALTHGHSKHPLRITIDGERHGSLMRYRISDNGPGIEKQYREQVFLVFNRLIAGGEGTGIGLAIVRRIVESCGGKAWLEETPNGGCSVIFELTGEDAQ